MDKVETEKKIYKIVDWIKDWFSVNGHGKNAFVGMSGGKDSLVTAILCKEALGASRVIGVGMPMNNYLKREVIGEDTTLAKAQCKALDISYYEIDILPAVQSILGQVKSLDNAGMITDVTLFNLPARIRMSAIYAFCQSGNGRVACTSNLSEDYIGWSTRWGDMCGDFQPLANSTAGEVMDMAIYFKDKYDLDDSIMPNRPTDGLCGKTDEDAFGFSYAVLDAMIRGDTNLIDEKLINKIETMHKANAFKMNMPSRPGE